MTTTGLEICEVIGPDRQRAYNVLRAVLHNLRDRLTVGHAAHRDEDVLGSRTCI